MMLSAFSFCRLSRAGPERNVTALRRGHFRICDGFLSAQRNDLDNRVIVRHAAWIEPAGRNDDVYFRPMALYAPRLDAINLHAPAEFAAIIPQQDGVSIPEAKPLRIFFRHDDVFPLEAGKGIRGTVNHAVELLAAPGGEQESVRGNIFFREANRGEVAFPIRR